MKKLFFIVFGLIFPVTALYSQELLDGIQETPKSVKRYDFIEVDKYQYDTYTVVVITDCLTKEKDYKLKISYDDGNGGKRVSYFSDGVVAELLKSFYYIIITQFEPVIEGEESYAIFEVCDGLYFKYRINIRRIELFVDDNHLLARISDEKGIKEFASLLLKIEKTFAEKGRDLKDAVITDDEKNEPILFQL